MIDNDLAFKIILEKKMSLESDNNGMKSEILRISSKMIIVIFQ